MRGINAMKLKYYLRGLGTGILFATIVLCIAYSYRESTSKNDSKDEESTTTIASNKDKEKDSTNESTKENSSTKEANASTSDEESTTEEATTEEPTTSTPTVRGELVEIVIERGYSSYTVAQILEEKGVIEDAGDFDKYLSDRDLDVRIATGVHVVAVGASYEEIAATITY